MKIWDAMRLFSSPVRRGKKIKKNDRKSKAHRPRDLRVERVEDRILLSISPTTMEQVWRDTLDRAIQQASDLSRYSDFQLSQTTDWVVGIDDSLNPAQLANALGAEYVAAPTGIKGAYVFRFDASVGWQTAVDRLSHSEGVVQYFYPLVRQERVPRYIPNDPFFVDQWHLLNTGQTGGTPGNDINVVGAWDFVQGDNVVIGIVDDGLQHTHPDLAANYRPDLSYDFNDGDSDPYPGAFDFHGTAVAGVAAAIGNNGVGVAGVAFDAQLAGLRLIGGPTTDLLESQALIHQADVIAIYNNSWGPPDAGVGLPFAIFSGPGPLTLAALQQGVTTGRNGLGTVYVWSAGNGGAGGDNSNYDGYASSRFTLAVASLDASGRQASYSEPGANLFVSAYADGIVTTDITGDAGYNATGTADGDPLVNTDYTSTFAGTSAAAPVVSGVIALMLQANPNLSYRDIQYILAETARPNDPTDPDWTTNAAGYHINHKYGFGAVDAAAAVQRARTWKPVGPEVALDSGVFQVNQNIPDSNPAGISSVISMAPDINKVEWVEVTVDISHLSPGDLEIVLVSPSGTQSVLATPHVHNPFDTGVQWTFTTNRNWGETSGGDWTLIVRDQAGGVVGRLNSWRLTIYGQQVPGTPPDLVAVIPNEGSLIEDGTELNVAPRELILRCNEGQSIDPRTLGAIQFVRAGGDDSFSEGNEVVVPIGYIGIGDKPNEVIVRFAENLPDDKYHLIIKGTGPNPLMNMDSPPLPFRYDPDLGVGQDLTLEFDLNLGPQILAVVPQPVYRGDWQITAPHGSQISDGRTFRVGDGTLSVTFEFDTGNGVRSGNVPILYSSSDSSVVIAQKIADAILSQGLNLTVQVAGSVVTIQGGQAFVDRQNSPLGVRSLYQERNIIEVYFNNDTLDRNAAENPRFYQLIFTQETANPFDDLVVHPISATYDPVKNVVRLDFGQDLANFGTGAVRLRIGNEYRPIQTWNMSEGGDAPSTFFNAISIDGGFGSGTVSQSVVISGSIVTPSSVSYNLVWPGAIDEPGHRDLPNYDSILIEDHYSTGESSPDGSTQIPTIPYYFPRASWNLITEAQKQRAREIFEIYGHYLGIQFYESELGGLAIVTGDLALMGLQSAPGGIGGVAGMGVAVMDYAENWGASEFGGAWFQVALHEIGHLLGYGHSYDLPPFVIMGSSEDAQAVVGSFEPVFPGVADIIHGRHMFRPDNMDIDMYRFDLGERGLVDIEVLAERLNNSSLLDAVVTLYREVQVAQKYVVMENGVPVEREFLQTTYEVVARNDDFYSEDSALRVYLTPGRYFIGVTASGNTQYDPTLDNSGIGGVTQGEYKLRVTYKPGGVNPDDPETFRDPNIANPSHLIDSTGVYLDGDLDGIPGGEYNFWFNVQPESQTIFVDKLSGSSSPTGSIDNPFSTIAGAFAAAQPGSIVRIVGNNFANDDPNDPATLRDNIPYEIGRRLIDNAPLPDGVRMDVPRGVTVMIDAGAMIKLFRSNIMVGSIAEGIDRSGGALQVLGTPFHSVYFTSYYDESLGRDPEPNNNTTPLSGDWGGIVFKNDLDYQFIRAYDPASGLPARQVLEDQGIFLNYISHADMRYGGGEVIVNGIRSVYDPIHMVEARPTVVFSRITHSADAAMSADPNSFADTKYQSWDPNAPYTVEYERIGPVIHGNYVVSNSINGLYVRVKTPAGSATKKLTTFGRWDDWDIVHYVPENLAIAGTPGGPLQKPASAPAVNLVNDFQIGAPAGTVDLDGQYFAIFDGRNRVVFEFDAGDGVVSGRIAVPFSATDSAAQVATSLANAINAARSSGKLDVSATASGDIVTLRQWGAKLVVEGLGTRDARLDARLMIDPGVIVKLQGSRIETEVGAQLIAEGRPGFEETVPGYKVVFTSILDNRYGAGGTFNTAQNTSGQQPRAGDWAGIGFAPMSEGSIDQAVIAYAGGQSAIEGGFAGFDPIEIRQAHVRIANTRFENNGANSAGDRNGRGFITPATIYVRGAQPVIVNNRFINNQGHVVSIDVNALNAWEVPDWGRSTGFIDAFAEYSDNFGPLVRGNRMIGNQLNGMEVRAGTLNGQGTWDDTDIVHILYGEIVIPNYHHEGGLRLQSARDKSLVVKLWGSNAGITVAGGPTEIDDRIGGILQIVGMPGYPVIFTSLADDSVGAGLDIFGNPQYDTNLDGDSTGRPGDWRSIKFTEYAHDRNVATVVEAETGQDSVDRNPYPQQAQYLGQLAPSEKAGDDNIRLGFDVYGTIRFSSPNDSDVYSFDATAGTEIWLDIDRTTFALDTIIELIDADGNVLARSDNSLNEVPQGFSTTLAFSMNRDLWVRSTSSDSGELGDYYSINPRDSGMRVVLPGPAGEVHTYYVRIRSPLSVTNIPDGSQIADGIQFLVSDNFQTIIFEFDKDGMLSDPNAVPVPITNAMTAAQVAAAMVTAINAQRDAKGFEVTARYQAGRLFLDGVHAHFNRLTTPVRVIENTSGHYQLQIRLKEMQEVAGGMVKYADVRYATNGIEILGQPAHHPLLGETSETTANNDTFGNAQELGNLLDIDRNTISLAGYLSGRTDVDWYRFEVDLQGIQSIGGFNDLGAIWSTIFDIDYADGMARPDLSIWVFDSQGRLILRSTDSSIADDMALVISNAIEDLNRGSVWPRDPYIGPVYLPESNGATYYIAVTSVLATPQVLSSVIGGTWSADSTAYPLVRLEPINSISRIVEEHIEGGAASGVTTVQERLSLVPDEFKLGDVVFYVITGNDLFTVDPFTGASETDVTDRGDPYLPGSPGIQYHDIAMRNDGRLMTITQGPGGDFNPRYREFDTGNANNLLLDTDTGINIIRRDPGNPNNLQNDPNNSLYVEAMVHYYANTGNLGRQVMIVGNVPNPDLGAGLTGITSGHNLVWILNPDGTAINHPLINNGQRASGDRLFSNIVPVGQLFTAPTILANPASQTQPIYQFPGGIQPRDFRDGDWFEVTDASGITYRFEFDLGIDVRINPQGAAAFRDGHFFRLVNAYNGQAYDFEFNSGPVIVLPATATGALDGAVVTIHGTAPGGGNVSISFEFDNNNALTNPGNVRVPFNVGDQGSALAANLVNAINAQATFTVVASSVNNRVSLVNDSQTTLPSSSSPLITIEGDHNVALGRQPINFEETWTSQQLGQQIEAVVDASQSLVFPLANRIDASYAYRATDAANPQSPGDRISFLNVSSFNFANAPGLSYVAGVHGAPTGARIPFGAGYTAQQMATAIANAINSAMGIGTANVVGATVELSGVAATNPVNLAGAPQLEFTGEGVGGDITGLAWLNVPGIGYRLFAVSNTGGLYYISNVTAYANGGSWGFTPVDPQQGVRFFTRIPGGGPQLHFITQVVNPGTGQPINFQGLAAGPQNVEDGRYATTLFANDVSGNVYALAIDGTLLGVFVNGARSINGNVGNVYGIDFSPIDYNLWHSTGARGNDPGHGVYSTYDDSRVPAEGYDPLREGNQSFYFGLEATGQLPQSNNFTTGQNSDGSKLFTYNLPGGAHGSLTSGVFSLKGYSRADKPTLYFNYYAHTENSNTFDGLRVYISKDGADWTLLATNTDLGAFPREEPGYGGYVREIIDLGGDWRQARIDLSQFAGLDNLRIRFDFSTASDMDIGNVMTGGEYLTTPAAAELHDGATFTIDGRTFEFDLGYALVLPNAAGIKIGDGEYLQVSDGTTVRTFEFDKDGAVQPGNIRIAINDNMTTRQVADVVATVMNGVAGFNVRAFVPADPTFSGANGGRVFLIGAQAVTQGSYGVGLPAVTIEGSAPGQYASGNIPVFVRPDMTQLETSKIITDAINRYFRAVPNQIYITPATTAASLNNTVATLVVLDAFNVPSYVVVLFSTATSVSQVINPGTIGLPSGTRADYALRVGLAGATTPAVIAQRIADAINLLQPDLRLQVSATVVAPTATTGFVQLYGPQAAFDPINVLNPSTSPLLQSDLNQTTVKLDDRSGDTIGGTQPLMRVFGVSVTDPGPLFHSDNLEGDDAAAVNRFADFRRGQNNNYEGWYIDDIIIGFAERGEMVVNAPAGVTGFDFLRQPQINEPIVVRGSYQLEIRRGDEFGNLVLDPYRVVPLQGQADTNDRWTQDITLLFPDATKIAHGDRFWIEDGLRRQTFVFLDQDIGTTQPLTPPLDGSEIPIYFTRPMSAGEIANAVATAINFAKSEGRLNVSAASIGTSERVDLWGATRAGGNLGGTNPQPLQQIIYGAVDPVLQPGVTLFHPDGNGHPLIGDRNLHREKGHIVVESTTVFNAREYGIRVEPGPRDAGSGNPHPGSGRTMNAPNQLVAGITLKNNLLAFNGQGGIRISGSTGQPTGASPFVRVVNNTIYGGLAATGVGIEVVNTAGPTLLNNVLANLNTGIRVDGSSAPNTVLGGNAYQGNNQNVQGMALGTFDRVLPAGAPLFVDPANYNFIPDRGSEIIDSSIDALQERFGYYNSVLQPIGLAPSPILAPVYDLYGQLRKDDPAVNPPPGGGLSVFKDRGAVDRVDFRGPTAGLIEPLDNDPAGIDRNPANYDVFIAGRRITRFAVRLSDEEGVGINDRTVVSGAVKVYREGVLLEDGKDYFFQYHPVDDIIYLVPASGVWSIGYTYKIELDNLAIRDLANNPLQPNRPDGTTYFLIYLAGIDFGDAPDAPYPTTLKNNGASHIIVPGFYLGSGVSNEPDARQNATATGDTFDDGVVFETGLLIGGDTQIEVIASADGYLDAWIDLNADGDWADAGEQVLTSYQLQSGENIVTISLPAGLNPTATFARFRFSTTGGLAPTGLAPDGEVEDYQVDLVPYHQDFGDAPDSYGTTLAADGARHVLGSGLYLGQSVDAELNGRPSVTAQGDDLAGIDDEDGVAFLDALVPNNPVEVQVVVNLPSGMPEAHLQAWVDFNANNIFDPTEQVFSNVVITSSGVHSFQFVVPSDAVKGVTYARFRLSSQPDIGPTGQAPDGEVEDYRVSIVDAPVDFGDAPAPYPTLRADGGARHRVVRGFGLGQLVDYELDGQPNSTATGDDSSDLADEDGVLFLTPLLTGELATIQVTVSQTDGYLNAWIDYNADGDWADPGEQIVIDQLITSTTTLIQFRVPRDLESTATFARFRYSHTPGLSYNTSPSIPDDQLPDGEVEDYLVNIIAGTSSITGYVFNDLNANGVWDLQPSQQIPPVNVLPPGAGNVIVPAGDDLASAAIPLGFDFEFFGKTYNQIYVSTNGLVSFNNPVTTFSASGFPQGEPVLAPFWADVDTRATGQIRLQRSTSARGNPVVQIDWINVGYFNQHNDKKNTFSLYIEDDPGGDIVVFHYFNMQWTTGDAQGANGFGAPGAVIGYDAGDGLHYATFARPSSPADLANLMARQEYTFRLDPNTGQLFGVEPGLAGVLVYVDLNNNGVPEPFEPVTYSQYDNPLTPNIDETGFYQFTGLFSGTYAVRHQIPTNWIQTYPPAGIVLPDGQTRHLRAPSGNELTDGNTFSLSNGTTTVVFEFDNNNMVASGNRRVPFTATDSPVVLAATIANAINSVAGFGITATADGDLINLAGPTVIFNPQTSPLQDVTTRSLADGSYMVTLGTGEQLNNVNFGDYRLATVSLQDVAVAEGNTGRTKVKVTVEITDSFGAPISFDYQTANGTATVADNDYIPASGTFVFTPQGVPRPTWDIQFLTKNTSNDYDFSVWSDKVVWESFDGQDWEIYYYDGTQTRRLTNNASDDRMPAVFGNRVVWSAYDGQDWEIYLYDAATHTTQQLTDNSYDDIDPQISDSFVAWTANVNGLQQIFVYDLVAGGEPVNVSNNSFNNYLPQVSGRNVVWFGFDGFDNEIYLYSSGTTRAITNNVLDDRYPRIDGSKVVWQQHDGTDWEIAVYDIPSGTTLLLTANDQDDIHPDISGNNVVFEHHDGLDTEIYYINLNIGPAAVKQITDNSAQDEMPRVYGDRLVWHAYIGGNWEVFYTDLNTNVIPRNISSDPGYDWYPAVTDQLVVWRSYRSGNYEVMVARQKPAAAKATIELEIVGDTRIEPDEYFFLNISNPQLAVVSDPQAQIWILNDDGSLDYGDAPQPYPTLLKDNGARHLTTSGLRLGSLLDAEPDGRPSAQANGDDTYISDDEDGVAFVTPLAVGAQATVIVTASGTGKLDAWIDFNQDGDWDDPGERIFAGRAVTAGNNSLTFEVPAAALLGTTFARFRLSSNGVDGPTGYAPDGEVEDYAVTIVTSTIQVTREGRRVIISGGPTDDEVSVSTSGNVHIIGVNGTQYRFNVTEIDEVEFDGAGGRDTITLFGTSAVESFLFTPSTARMTRTGFAVFASNVERMVAHGNGGLDGAQLYDSPGDDTLEIRPGLALMSGPGYSYELNGIAYVHGYASTGSDSADLHGTTGDDTLIATQTEARLTSTNYVARAKFFDNVRAFAGGAGTDVANLTGSAGIDTIQASPTSASMGNGAVQISAWGFDSVTISGGGGDDVAQLYDSPGNDVLIAQPSVSTLSGPGYVITLQNVPIVHAYASAGGMDVAQLYDTGGDDLVIMTPEYTRITGTNYNVRAKFFDYVHAYSANGGFDIAKLYGSAGNDTLTVTPQFARLKGPGFYNRAKLFERVEVYGGGGYDTGDVWDSPGVDHLSANSIEALLQNPDLPYYVYLTQMEKVKVRATSPYNTKRFEGVVDWLIATGFWTDV